MVSEFRTASTSSSSSPCLSDTKQAQEPLVNGSKSRKKARKCSAISGQDGGSPVASTSTQLASEVTNTVNDEMEQTTVNRGCSSSKTVRNSSAEDIEEKKVSHAKAMQRAYSSSLRGQQLLPSVPEDMEKYFEGCLVIACPSGLPFCAGMIRRPDEYLLDHAYLDVGRDKYIYEQHGDYVRLYVQTFEDFSRLRLFSTRSLQLFDENLKGLETEPQFKAIYEASMKIVSAASKYSVKERLKKFTLLKETPLDNLLAEIENVNSQSSALSNNITFRSREKVITQTNGESSTVCVARVKNLVTDTRRKLRETEEANRSLKMENSNLVKKIDELEASVRELKRELEKEREEKRECQEKLEKMGSDFQNLEEFLEDEMMETVP